MERAQVSGAATWTRGWSSLVGSGMAWPGWERSFHSGFNWIKCEARAQLIQDLFLPTGVYLFHPEIISNFFVEDFPYIFCQKLDYL